MEKFGSVLFIYLGSLLVLANFFTPLEWRLGCWLAGATMASIGAAMYMSSK